MCALEDYTSAFLLHLMYPIISHCQVSHVRNDYSTVVAGLCPYHIVTWMAEALLGNDSVNTLKRTQQ
jgi:hypothetical protein